MQDTNIQPFSAGSTALNAERYQTFEMAKENDTILGGDSIAQIRSYAAYARAQAQAIHKTIAATSGLEDVTAIKAEALETEQTFAKVGLYADQRIGEILRELPKARAGRKSNDSIASEEFTKADAIQDAGISKSQAYDLQAMAANPDVVQAVLDKAEQDGTIPSRSQVLKAIRERDAAERELENTKSALAEAYQANDLIERQVASLQEQVAQRPEPEVVEREVVREVAPADYDELARRVKSLESGNRQYHEDYQRVRKRNEELRGELDKAKELLGMDKTIQDVRSDVQYLIMATNSYVRRYGGLTWTVQQLESVDRATREDLKKAATNLATFASALVASLEEM